MTAIEWVSEDLGPSDDEPPHRARWRLSYPRWWVAGSVLVAGLIVGFVIGWLAGGDSRHDSGRADLAVSGVVEIRAFSFVGSTADPLHASCYGVDADSGLQAGTPLVVSDVQSHILGAALLRGGHLSPNARLCQFPFQVRVPATGHWYRIQVGTRPAGAFTPDELDDLRIRLG